MVIEVMMWFWTFVLVLNRPGYIMIVQHACQMKLGLVFNQKATVWTAVVGEDGGGWEDCRVDPQSSVRMVRTLTKAWS